MGYGPSDTICKYLMARRMTSSAAFVFAGNDAKEAADKYVDKLKAGHTIEGVEYKITDTDELMDLHVILTCLWSEIKVEQQREQDDYNVKLAKDMGVATPGSSAAGATPADPRTRRSTLWTSGDIGSRSTTTRPLMVCPASFPRSNCLEQMLC